MVSAILSDASPAAVSSQFESTLLRNARAIAAAAATDASRWRDVSRVARAATVNCVDCFRAADRLAATDSHWISQRGLNGGEVTQRQCAMRRGFTVFRGGKKNHSAQERFFFFFN